MPQAVAISGTSYICDRVSDECPICHFSIEPREVNTLIRYIRDIPIGVEFVYQCPRSVCCSAFIARYRIDTEKNTLVFLESVPVAPREPDVPEEVDEISETFKEIYKQAMAAEDHQLNEIAGVGYRKALEFLVKDYCIKQHPDYTKEIEKKFLGQCIEEYVDNGNIKTCAKRAAWLGNDETHFVRKWESKDIEDLKRLIQLTMNWIQSDVLTREYEEQMPG